MASNSEVKVSEFDTKIANETALVTGLQDGINVNFELKKEIEKAISEMPEGISAYNLSASVDWDTLPTSDLFGIGQTVSRIKIAPKIQPAKGEILITTFKSLGGKFAERQNLAWFENETSEVVAYRLATADGKKWGEVIVSSEAYSNAKMQGVNNVKQAIDFNLQGIEDSVIFGNSVVNKTTEGGDLNLLVSAGYKIRLCVFYGFGKLKKAHDTDTVIGKVDSFLCPQFDMGVIGIDTVSGEVLKITFKTNGDLILHPHESFGNNIVIVSTTYIVKNSIAREIDQDGNFILD